MEKKSPEEIYEGLRSMALSVRPEPLGVEVGVDEPYVALMEFRVGEHSMTLVAVLDGSASMYFSTGGGNIGGGKHESIRDAAQAMIGVARTLLDEMQVASEFPLPSPGIVVFYVVTPSYTYTAVDDEDALGQGRRPLSPLFYAGHEVITEYRRVLQQSGG